MIGISAFLLPLLLLTVVDSKRSKTHVKNNQTIKEHLRVYVTERTTTQSWGQHNEYNPGKSIEEKGKHIHLLDLKGYINERFALEAASTDPSLSVICSPLSAMMPVGILLYGAGNHKTEKDILHAVGLNKQSKAHDHFRKLRHQIKHLSGPTTYLANRIYYNEEKKLKTKFKEQAKDTFGDCLESVNMKDEARTANKINQWVTKHTEKKIDKILSASDISPKASVVIVNALYFKGRWMHEFEGSHISPFHGAKGQTELNLMYCRGHYMYGASKALAAQAIVIPYKGDASMVVLLPFNKDGLSLLLRELKLAPDLINKIKMKQSYVDLRLPKFEIETTLDLKILYEKIGLTEIFSAANGLEGLVKGETVVIDKAIHKAIIQVNEMGTVAGVVSAVGGVGSAMPPPDMVYFTADHPFLFFIVAHRQQLFAGTFVG